MPNRWWVYQRERFPLAAHAPLVLVLVASAHGVASTFRDALPSPFRMAGAFVVALLLFFQLRVADEFKDHDEDAAHRPYRPVPRGLVSLRELRALAGVAAVAQLALTLAIDPVLAVYLAAAWTYALLMTKEFFVASWLKARPVVYLLSHMVILPLIVLLVVAFDAPRGLPPPAPLALLLGMAFAGGVVMELGRKIRAPADEEAGVETYSALWGAPRALRAWLLALAVATALALALASSLGARIALATAILVGLAGAAALLASSRFRRPETGAGRAVERASAVWTLAAYAGVGLVPLALEAIA